MKRKDILILSAVATYSYLFYNQLNGINFLLFTLLMITFLFIRNNQLIKQPSWIVAACGSIMSSVAVFLYGNRLSFDANIISLGLLSAFSLNSQSSLFIALLNSIYSATASLIWIAIDWAERKKSEVTKKHPAGVRALLITIPLFVLLVFFSLYRNSNPLFNNFTQNINLDFISGAWIQFTLVGFVFIYSFFNHRYVESITGYDLKHGDALLVSNSGYKSLLGKEFKIEHEHLSGIILFSLLNALLLIVNVLDVEFLWLNGKLPDGLTYSQFVHQGTGTLITSIIFAVLIILFYFRNSLNFLENNKSIKALAYIWITQNIFMIVSTAYRNMLYVNEYSLTYKRIGVYVYLLLCIIGLVLTFVKIFNVKSNWFLFRKNGWAFYIVLIASAFFNWDEYITHYNIERAEKTNKVVDKKYLLGMGSLNITQLLKMNENLENKNLNDDEANSGFSSSRSTENYSDYLSAEDFNRQLHQNIYTFSKGEQEHGWQSFCYERNRIYSELENMNMNKKITEINLSGSFYTSLKPIQYLSRIEKLNFANNRWKQLEELDAFKELRELNISTCGIDSLQSLPEMKQLTKLDIADNRIIQLSNLSKLPLLQELNISLCGLNSINDLPVLPKLYKLDCYSNNLSDVRHLSKFVNLTELDLSRSLRSSVISFGEMPSLKKLDVADNGLGNKTTNIATAFKNMTQLEVLNLDKNNIVNLKVFIDSDVVSKQISSFQNLKTLSVSDNSISSMSDFEIFNRLENLDASKNIFTNLNGIELLRDLNFINLSECKSLEDISTLQYNHQLVSLNLASCTGIKKFDVLKSLSGLTELNLSSTTFNNSSQLETLINLKSLDISNTGVTDFSFLQKLKHLEHLNIKGCYITDYSKLYSLKQLKSLTLNDDVSYIEIQKLKKQLPKTEIIYGGNIPINKN